MGEDKIHEYFSGRTILIATQHKKEEVIAPLLKAELNLNVIVANEINTDALGTFSGEVERTLSPIEAARKKCELAMTHYNCDLAIASEGSFGPHPALIFVPSDEEFLVLIDKKNDLEIIAREISTETNFAGEQIQRLSALTNFANKALFPEHNLIIKKDKTDTEYIFKGINTWTQLNLLADEFIQQFGSFYIETDMRAMHNPMRMKVIEKTTQQLIQKIKNLCPHCETPGFSIIRSKAGLPCDNCGFPTRSILSYIYSCKKCNHLTESIFPLKKETEDPMYCDVCNP